MAHWYVWTRVLFVTLSGFIFGYDIGAINGVKDMEGYRHTLNLSAEGNISNETGPCNTSQDDVETTAILGLIVALLSVGCLVGALMGGFISDLAGRKPTVILGAILVTGGGMLHTGAINLWMVLPSRVISGLGVGILYQVVSLYVAEISPEKTRGRMQSFITIYATLGIFLGNVLNFFLKDFTFGWRISIGVEVVVGGFLALGMFLLPRSPRWLVKQHRDEQALQVLIKVYKDENRAQIQLKEIQSVVGSTTKEPLLETLRYVSDWKILQRLLLGYLVMILGRFSGLSFITTFSVTIFCDIGLPGFAASMGFSAVGLISMLLSLTVIDKLGRKPVFLTGLLIMVSTLISSAVLVMEFDLESGAPSSSYSRSQLIAAYSVLVLACLYMGTAAISVGSIPWIVASEIFPLRGRGFMVSVNSTAYWIGLIVINQVSPILISSRLNISGTFFFFGTVSTVLLLFVLLFLPETKDRTLEKIEELFSLPWYKRGNVLYYLRCACFLKCATKPDMLETAPINEPNILHTDLAPDSGERESLLKKIYINYLQYLYTFIVFIFQINFAILRNSLRFLRPWSLVGSKDFPVLSTQKQQRRSIDSRVKG